MADSSASPSLSSSTEKNDMTLEGALPEAMDTQSKPNTVDARLPETLNTGPNAVAMVTSLRDAAAMGAKEMSVDESHHSEALGPSQEPAPTELPVTKGLNESRSELLQRVQALKKDLENWRGKLDTQVKSYREELGDLRSALNSEVEQLRVEFQDLRNTLKQQRELTATKLAKLDEPADALINSKQPLSTTEETN